MDGWMKKDVQMDRWMDDIYSDSYVDGWMIDVRMDG